MRPLLACESYIVLLLASLQLRLFNAQRFSQPMRQPACPSLSLSPEEEQRTIDNTIQYLKLAERLMPVRLTCLQRAIALQKLLCRKGISTSLQIGVRKRRSDLQAHAWIEYQSRILNDTVENCKQYQPLRKMMNQEINSP